MSAKQEGICTRPDTVPASWVCADWVSDSGTKDLGIGLLVLVNPPTFVRRGPSRDAPVVAALETYGIHRLFWSAAHFSPNAALYERSEDGSEEAGIPIDSVNVTKTWARAILGFDSLGTPLLGWTELGQDTVFLWSKRLQENSPLHFLGDSSKARLYATPNDSSTPGSGQRLGPNDDYFMASSSPPDVRGHWMRVQVTNPHNECDAVRPPTKTATPRAKQNASYYWIRYLDDRGRPLVMYTGPEDVTGC